MDDVGLVAREVAKGECILFLGAGVHAAPPGDCQYTYPEEDRPPIGSQLSLALAAESGFAQEFPKEDPRNLQRVSLHYERKFRRNRLVERVLEAVDQDKKPSAAVRALAQLEFPIIVTTNYDQIVERALRQAGKEPQISVYDPDHAAQTEDCRTFDSRQPLVFKIHGDITHPSSIVITDEDYRQFVMRMGDRGPYHPVPETVAYYMKRWPTLFVGYSLMDYNLRLLFKSLRWKVDRSNQPEAYSVDLYPDPLIVDVYANERRQVQFIAQDVWRFVPALYSRVLDVEMPG
jgi:hypothetical protein